MRRSSLDFDESGSPVSAMRAALEEVMSEQRLKGRLDRVLYELLADMKAITPVRTGLLKGSGYATSEIEGDEWTGTITFGTGLHYTEYVMNREPNPFDALVNSYEPRFSEAIEDVDDRTPRG